MTGNTNQIKYQCGSCGYRIYGIPSDTDKDDVKLQETIKNHEATHKNKGGRPKNCGRCLKPKTECNCGRPPVIDATVLQKLEDAFMFCYTDEEACLYAGISRMTLHNYQKQNPEFVDRKKALRLTPNLAAKKELVGGIKGNLNQARWWAQNKMNNEFGEKTTIKHEGAIDLENEAVTEGMDKAVKAFNETMRKVLTTKKPKDENTN